MRSGNGCLDIGKGNPVSRACDGHHIILGGREQLGTRREVQGGDGGGMVEEGAQFPIPRMLHDRMLDQGRIDRTARIVRRRRAGELIEVNALVGASTGQDDLLGALGRRVRRERGDGQASDGRGVRMEEEGVGKFWSTLASVGSRMSSRKRCRDTLKDAFIGTDDNLHCCPGGGVCWCCGSIGGGAPGRLCSMMMMMMMRGACDA